MSGGRDIFVCDEAHELRCQTHGEWVNVVMFASVFRLFKSPLYNVEALRGEHVFACSVYVVHASYCGNVHF